MYKNNRFINNFYKTIDINGIKFNVYIIFRRKHGISYYVRDESILIYSSKYYSYETILAILNSNSKLILRMYEKNKNKIDTNYYKSALNKEKYLFMGEFREIIGDFIPYRDYFKKYEGVLREIYSKTMNEVKMSDVKLIIKPLKSKWGSYNAKSNYITLNLFLLFFEKPLIESVIYHEICHIGNLSHNRKFHNDLDVLCPKNKEFRKKINELTPLVKKLQELE